MVNLQFWKKKHTTGRLEVTNRLVLFHRGWNETPEIVISLTARKYGNCFARPTKLVGSLKAKDYFFQILWWENFDNHNSVVNVSSEQDVGWCLRCPLTEEILAKKAGDFYLEIQAEYFLGDIQKMLFYNTAFGWDEVLKDMKPTEG